MSLADTYTFSRTQGQPGPLQDMDDQGAGIILRDCIRYYSTDISTFDIIICRSPNGRKTIGKGGA